MCAIALMNGNVAVTRRTWLKAVDMAGLDGVHFHDLRHTENALTAGAGANLRELMGANGSCQHSRCA